MKVKIIYRNYKSLHDLYYSFTIKPPEDVSFIIPPPRKVLRYLYPLYRVFGDNFFVKQMISGVQDLFFYYKEAEEDVDVLHFVQFITKRIPTRPYIIDFEHIAALANFVKLDRVSEHRIFNFLNNAQCHRIIPMTCAAKKSFKHLFPDFFREVEDRTEVIYPALPNYHALFNDQIDYSYVSPHSETFKLLFIGNDVYRKGLHELLSAFKKLEDKYNNIELYVISDAPRQLKRDYSSGRIKYLDPVFSPQDIIKKFYMACDLFVMPTHCDTFGMAILNSLSCGTPVITTEQFATPEIIKPERNGLFVRSNRLFLDQVLFPSRKVTIRCITDDVETLLVDELVEKIEYLYLKRDVLGSMGEEAIKDFEVNGKFSIDIRNEKLKAVYRSCNTILDN